MFIIECVDDLWNHIAYVLAYAPDRFPVEDFLPPDQQMNLERAFQQLREGLEIAYPEAAFAEKRRALSEVLSRCYTAYQARNEIEAGHLLNDFEAGIFQS